MCISAYETWKQYQWIMRTLTKGKFGYARLSKVAAAATWLVPASYSAWHFFADDILKENIPGLAAYFDNSAVYFKTFWQPWLYWRPFLKAFPVFNVLETCRVYYFTDDWSWDCQVYEKMYWAVFWIMWNLKAWTKLCAKTVTKAAECRLIKFFFNPQSHRAIPLLFCTQFLMELNHYEMKPCFQSLTFS